MKIKLLPTPKTCFGFLMDQTHKTEEYKSLLQVTDTLQSVSNLCHASCSCHHPSAPQGLGPLGRLLAGAPRKTPRLHSVSCSPLVQAGQWHTVFSAGPKARRNLERLSRLAPLRRSAAGQLPRRRKPSAPPSRRGGEGSPPPSCGRGARGADRGARGERPRAAP